LLQPEPTNFQPAAKAASFVILTLLTVSLLA
jgi:hypothetical protein